MYEAEDVTPFGIGVILNSLNLADIARQTKAADENGFSSVSVGDNPEHMLDTYVSLTYAAQAAERCHVGTTITTPIHRDPLVVATAFSSVETIHRGHVFIGIGTGRARQKSSIRELREHIVALRELWSSGKSTFRGVDMRLSWDANPVPIVLCASGPRALRLGGELADAVIVESGLTPELIENAKRQVADGALAAGRNPSDIKLCWYARTSIGSTEVAAVDDCLPSMAAAGAFLSRRTSGLDDVPTQHHAKLRTLAEKYDMSAHFRTDRDNPNRRLLDDEPLRDYLIERMGVVGTPAQWVSRIDRLRELGVHNILCVGAGSDKDAMIDLVGQYVIPKLAGVSSGAS
ncbi:LLM class flavin-dependent oxidoreductase [Rhodococcus globerulus]|uniref:LLM class flavin-dependent oxidoreductase n=1 Tax=Rhodococcus globerulus TaxID=33008 RepID=A0ABU4C4W8_RHOGO|nr:LLM class flavin-dependent oxidoreductase [Rhodococcus globerulus]MDV6271459.1 LLM class flavin-dependent oxidoreductase [Rhodococcus globerulus]